MRFFDGRGGEEFIADCEDGSTSASSMSCTTRLRLLLYNYGMNFFL